MDSCSNTDKTHTHGSTTLLPQLAMFSFESFEHAVAKSTGLEGNAAEGGLPTSEQASGCVSVLIFRGEVGWN
jgi:hypothetical protein